MIKTLAAAGLMLLAFTAQAETGNRFYLSLGAQGGQWKHQDEKIGGKGWMLDGNLPLSRNIGLVGQYRAMSYEPDSNQVVDFETSEWQLGARWQQTLSSRVQTAVQYRYLDRTLETESAEGDDQGHRGQADLYLHFPGDGYTQRPGVLELSAGQTEYDEDSLWFARAGYRLYLNRNFSLALHLEAEDDTRRFLTFSIREEK